MPKAPKKKTNQAGKPGGSALSAQPKNKDPKASHLYTNDNPATTIEGTGFRNPDAANHTFELISKRSLFYKFQIINTLWHRANSHPHKNSDIEEAMKIFREWLDKTYPEAKASLRAGGWKPLLSKPCVKRYLPQIRERQIQGMDEARQFAERYVGLTKGKRLANVLVDDDQPEGPDWERQRYDALSFVVSKGREQSGSWEDHELWDEERKVTDEHLKLIAWAWSPLGERKLP